ncbi:MAG: hypothetical protein IPL92_15610 [Saprospiraceae bacterium]|nr:hypothetical protein [Candidatus Opimibacter iunctus]
MTRTYVITDLCGNSSTTVAVINVNDTTAPVGSAPCRNLHQQICASNAVNTIHLNVALIAANYTDNCGGQVTVIPTDTVLITDNCEWVLPLL